MKAYVVNDKDDYFSNAVVFAETRGKAKSYAMNSYACQDTDFCDIEVRRVKEIDKYYVYGKREMDWEYPKDRLALVKELGYYCNEPDEHECTNCIANTICDYCLDCLHICGNDGDNNAAD